MHVADYLKNVFVPANTALSAMRMAGIPVDSKRVRALREDWERKLGRLERYLIDRAEKRGIKLTFSAKHSGKRAALQELFYGAKGLGLEVKEYTEKGNQPAISDDALMSYASIANPWDDDVPEVKAYLLINSYAKGVGTYLKAFDDWRRADGCLHPNTNWAKVMTARISMSNPAFQNIPERGNMDVAQGIRSCLVPRLKPAPSPEDWDPRKHGSVVRWDISGAEAAIRGAMLTYKFCTKPEVLWEYIRLGKDVHGRTASVIYGKPEGTYGKGSIERDAVGKQVFFATLFGGDWQAVQRTVWKKARIWLDDDEAKRITAAIKRGYPRLQELYERDAHGFATRGYVEDGYGRRRAVPMPPNVKYAGFRNGKAWFDVSAKRGTQAYRDAWRMLSHCRHVAANTPTQGINATDSLFMMALCYHGEYIELAVPPMWESQGGVLFPEAKYWRLHEGRGPGGRAFQAWQINTVHDSGWLDCGPGWLEPTVKLCARRCTAVPFDWRIETDVPYRIDVSCGPDFGHLRDYNEVAKEFGMEPLPKR